jgi:hypothetical protein
VCIVYILPIYDAVRSGRQAPSFRRNLLLPPSDLNKARNAYCYSDNLIPEVPKTAHSCSRHGPAAASLTSARPGDVIRVPETSTLFGVGLYCLSSSQRSITLLIVSLFVMNYFVRNLTVQVDPVFKRHYRVMRLVTQCFWNGEGRVGPAYAVLPPWPACLFTPALLAIRLSEEKENTYNATLRLFRVTIADVETR